MPGSGLTPIFPCSTRVAADTRFAVIHGTDEGKDWLLRHTNLFIMLFLFHHSVFFIIQEPQPRRNQVASLEATASINPAAAVPARTEQ